MTTIPDLNGVPPGTPPPSNPPRTPPNQPTGPGRPPTNPPPPSKSVGVMHGWLIPDDMEMPKFSSRKTPKAPKPPRDLHGTCMVGELLVPLFGRSWVDEVTAEGGLVPYLVRRVLAVLFPARSPEAYR